MPDLQCVDHRVRRGVLREEPGQRCGVGARHDDRADLPGHAILHAGDGGLADGRATRPCPAERGAVGPRGIRPAARYAGGVGPDASGFPASVRGVHSTSIA